MPAPLVCLSHLRWEFVCQRPQHLMSRFARQREVIFVEEPVFDTDELSVECRYFQGVQVVTPHLPAALEVEGVVHAQQVVLRDLITALDGPDYVLWYYTPLALDIARDLDPFFSVYDCMDELSLFEGASPALAARERELLARVDLVFTGGQSLYETKRLQHGRVFAFPSSVDRAHFAQARGALAEPVDQTGIGYPRLGFFGVIDERMDLALLTEVARQRPHWQIVVLGPVVKIDPATLPRQDNIHYLGAKDYADLPAYAAGWDVALMPFALNDATRFISPTKTLEYLAAGMPVVSTPIRDVVRPYGEQGVVAIGETAAEVVAAVEQTLALGPVARAARQSQVDKMLDGTSWDRTWDYMRTLIDAGVAARTAARASADRARDRVVLAGAHGGHARRSTGTTDATAAAVRWDG